MRATWLLMLLLDDWSNLADTAVRDLGDVGE